MGTRCWNGRIRVLCVLVLLGASAMDVAQGKRVKMDGVYVSPGVVNEISKFSFETGGTGWIRGNITYRNVPPHMPRGMVYFFIDKEFDTRYHGAEFCEKVSRANNRVEIGKFGPHIGQGLGHVSGKEPVPSENQIGRHKALRWEFEFHVEHYVRTYVWYVVIADCPPGEDGKVPEKTTWRTRRRVHQINVELEFLQPSGSHLPADEAWLDRIYIVTSMLMTAFFALRYKRELADQPIVKLLATAYILQIVSMVFEIIHLVSYSYDGFGYFMLDLFSEILEGLSATFVSFVLLSLANGYMLSIGSTDAMFKTFSNPSADVTFFFLLGLLVLLSTGFQIANKFQDDAFLKFHDHESYAGYFLVSLRLVLGLLFCVSMNKTISGVHRSDVKFVFFMKALLLMGTTWFLSLPLTVFIAMFWASYLKHFFVSSCVLISQTLALTTLLYQITNEKSSLGKFSKIHHAGMLPFAVSYSPSHRGDDKYL